jgi:hypothetical protein
VPYPAFQPARDFDHKRRTAGNITTGSTNWADVDTGIDIVLNADTDDVIEVGLSALIGTEAFDIYLDAVTVVSGSPVNSVGAAGAVSTAPPPYGVSGWYGWSGEEGAVGCSVLYTVVAGDLSSGTVTFRLRYATQSGSSRTLYAQTNNPLAWYAKNLGPKRPT